MTATAIRIDALDRPNLRASEGAGTTTLSYTGYSTGDNLWQIFNLSAARTVVLPSANILAGQKVRMENRTVSLLTVQSSNGSALTIANSHNTEGAIRSGYIEIMALQATPTTPAHWRTIDCVEDTTMTTLPTSSNFTNIDSATPVSEQYSRSMNEIRVFGVITLDLTTQNTDTVFHLTLSVARSSNFASNHRASGLCNRGDTALITVGATTFNNFGIASVSGAQRVAFRGSSTSPNSNNWVYNYTYRLD